MTRDEFKILVKGLKSVYTQPSFIPDKDSFEIWYELLADLDYKTCSNAIKKHMQMVEKEPTPASIRKQIVSLQVDKEELNEMVAWQLVLKAMRNSIYHADEEFERLPRVVQKVVVNPGQLREWAMAENVDGTWMNVTQSNFMRTYRAESAKEKEMQKLSPDLLKLVQHSVNPIAKPEFKRKEISVREEREEAERKAVPMPERLKGIYGMLNGTFVE